MRIACVLIHNLPVQVARLIHPGLSGKKLVIGGLPFEAKPVLDASPEAVACGIAPGMPLREAYALCPEAVFLPLEETRHEAAFKDVLDILDDFSPVVEEADLGYAYLDVGGVVNEQGLARDIATSVSAKTGLVAQVGISSGKFFSYIAALTSVSGTPVTIVEGKERNFIAPASITALPCSVETRGRLRLLGIRFIGELSRFSREALIGQFGTEGILLYNAACGIDRTPLVPRRRLDVACGAVEFDSPTTTSAEILQACQVMLERLLEEANSKGKLCREVRLKATLTNGTRQESSLCLKEPTSSVAAVLRRLSAWLDTTRFKSAVSVLELSLALTSESGKNFSLWKSGKAVQTLGKLAGELSTRFGYHPLKQVQVVDADAILPERRFRLIDLAD